MGLISAKWIAFLTSICISFSGAMVGCGNETTEPSVGMANPMTEHASLEEVNTLVGSRMTHPGVMGVSDEKFFTIDGEVLIGEYDFSLNGQKYTMRAGKNSAEDISGVYVEGEPAFRDLLEENSTEMLFDKERFLARWCTNGIQYTFMLNGGYKAMEEETFESFVEEMQMLTVPVMSDEELEAFYRSLDGNYQDSVSQRATMTVTAQGSNGVEIQGSWSSSASDAEEWTLHASLNQATGKLEYDDCVKESAHYDEDGTRTISSYWESDGYFELEEGKLLWTGSKYEGFDACVFEKMVEE